MKAQVNFDSLGGGGNYDVGTFTVTGGSTASVPLSFKAKKLVVYCMSTGNGGKLSLLYDEDVDSSNQYQGYNAGSNAFTAVSFPTSNGDAIRSIDANGFVYGCTSGNWAGTFSYIAIG